MLRFGAAACRLVSFGLVVGSWTGSVEADFTRCPGKDLEGFEEAFEEAIACLSTIPELQGTISQAAAAGFPVCYQGQQVNVTTQDGIWWDPFDTNPLNGGIDGTKTPHSTLAHELCHAAQRLDGDLGELMRFNPCGVRQDESEAVKECENQVRERAATSVMLDGREVNCPMGEHPGLPPSERLKPRQTIQGKGLCEFRGVRTWPLDSSETCDDCAMAFSGAWPWQIESVSQLAPHLTETVWVCTGSTAEECELTLHGHGRNCRTNRSRLYVSSDFQGNFTVYILFSTGCREVQPRFCESGKCYYCPAGDDCVCEEAIRTDCVEVGAELCVAERCYICGEDDCYITIYASLPAAGQTELNLGDAIRRSGRSQASAVPPTIYCDLDGQCSYKTAPPLPYPCNPGGPPIPGDPGCD